MVMSFAQTKPTAHRVCHKIRPLNEYLMRQNCLNFYWLFCCISLSVFRLLFGATDVFILILLLLLSFFRLHKKCSLVFNFLIVYRIDPHKRTHACLHTHANGHPVESFIFHFGQTENTQRDRGVEGEREDEIKRENFQLAFDEGQLNVGRTFQVPHTHLNPPAPLSLSLYHSLSLSAPTCFDFRKKHKKKRRKGKKYDNSWAIVFDMTFYQKQICSSLLSYVFSFSAASLSSSFCCKLRKKIKKEIAKIFCRKLHIRTWDNNNIRTSRAIDKLLVKAAGHLSCNNQNMCIFTPKRKTFHIFRAAQNKFDFV